VALYLNEDVALPSITKRVGLAEHAPVFLRLAQRLFTDNDLQMFKEGRVGSYRRYLEPDELEEAIGEDTLAIDPWPVHDLGSLSGFVQSEGVYLSAHGSPAGPGDDPLLAWKFIEFFQSPESQADLIEVGAIPAISPENLPPVEADSAARQAMDAPLAGQPILHTLRHPFIRRR
jgi:ABC-type glycerol-3-phosphate transport system substrate-binding protein